MSVFENVTVVREANVYFEGKVTSRTVQFADGTKKTLGVMLPGEYTFGTGAPEVMEIMAGDLEVLLPGETSWRGVKPGESFNVAGDSEFSLKVKSVVDYCCSYLAS
nr:pyrimidine/purine nucleoside phosphorylase [uncultured Desulfobulbus sp.]